MYGLILCEKFRGRRLKGTAIEAVGPGCGQLFVLMRKRGQRKFHVIGVLAHALRDEASTTTLLRAWKAQGGYPTLTHRGPIEPRGGGPVDPTVTMSTRGGRR